MTDDHILPIALGGFVDTSGERRIMIAIDVTKARAVAAEMRDVERPGGARENLPSDLARVLTRLILGQPVPSVHLARWHLDIAKLVDADAAKALVAAPGQN